MALRLLMRLLHWDPASRPSARQVGKLLSAMGARRLMGAATILHNGQKKEDGCSSKRCGGWCVPLMTLCLFSWCCAVCSAGPEPRLLHGASSSLAVPHVCSPGPAGMVLRC